MIFTESKHRGFRRRQFGELQLDLYPKTAAGNLFGVHVHGSICITSQQQLSEVIRALNEAWMAREGGG